jgi:hypothetical protein
MKFSLEKNPVCFEKNPVVLEKNSVSIRSQSGSLVKQYQRFISIVSALWANSDGPGDARRYNEI